MRLARAHVRVRQAKTHCARNTNVYTIYVVSTYFRSKSFKWDAPAAAQIHTLNSKNTQREW